MSGILIHIWNFEEWAEMTEWRVLLDVGVGVLLVSLGFYICWRLIPFVGLHGRMDDEK